MKFKTTHAPPGDTLVHQVKHPHCCHPYCPTQRHCHLERNDHCHLHNHLHHLGLILSSTYLSILKSHKFHNISGGRSCLSILYLPGVDRDCQRWCRPCYPRFHNILVCLLNGISSHTWIVQIISFTFCFRQGRCFWWEPVYVWYNRYSTFYSL